MPDQWFAVVRSATGEAVSFGTVLAPELPEGLAAVEIDHQPGAGERWDPETRAVVSAASPEPDVNAFYRAVAVIFGGGTDDASRARGASRLYALDRNYPGIDRNLRDRSWEIALAGITALLVDGVVTQEQYDAIQVAWDAAHLGRPPEA